MSIAVNVMKRNGRLEPFNPDKITQSCMKAGAAKIDAQAVADEVSRKVYINIPSNEIRKLVEKQLENLAPAAARAYRAHELTFKLSAKKKEVYRHRHKPKIRKQK